jgi:C-terminal processing protease CtpA/Prc
VYGLSKFWQEVNYNFAYFDRIDRHSWDSAYKALIPEVQATKNDYEYYRLLKRFCALLHDGHTEVLTPHIKGVDFINNMFGDYLVVLTRVDNKVIVKRTWKKDAQKFPLGSEVIQVNGLPTEAYIKDSLAPYISASTDDVRKNIASGQLLTGFPGSVFTVKLRKPDGQTAVYSLTHARTTDSILYPALGVYLDEKQRKAVEWKSFPDHIAYVALNTFLRDLKADSIFESILPVLKASRGIIIDLRYNGGGDDGVAFDILRHFITDTVFTGESTITRSYDPYLKAIGRYVDVADTTGNKLKKEAWLLYHGYPVYDKPGIERYHVGKGTERLTMPVVVLTSRYTESAAEDFLIGTDRQKNIVRIGEPTCGSTGMPYSFDLPGGGGARICVVKDTYPDGREFVGKGIQPDILVVPTVDDYLKSRDVILETALKYLERGVNKDSKSPHGK